MIMRIALSIFVALCVCCIESYRLPCPRMQQRLFTSYLNQDRHPYTRISSQGLVFATSESERSDETNYVKCSKCTTCYEIKAADFGARGKKVRCGVCGKEWFQAAEKILSLRPGMSLMPTNEERLARIKRDVELGYLPTDKMQTVATVFVGNLPFKYTEENIDQLFAEYGIVDSVIIRDNQQRSKGFGFIGFASRDDALKCIAEMQGFLVEGGRSLNVREGDSPTLRPKFSRDRQQQRREEKFESVKQAEAQPLLPSSTSGNNDTPKP